MKLHRFLVILTIALIIVLAIIIWFFPSSDDFRSDNPFWNGIKNANSTYEALPLESLSDLPLLPHGSTLILIPYLNFTPTELEGLDSFVTRGGRLILADDYGLGNQLLEHLGLEVRFSQQPLLDPLFNHRNRRFPRISHIIASPITSNTESLILNHATSLTNVEAGDVLALSSLYSFLDLNGNESLDEDEPVGPLPVVSQHNLNNGSIILISDPSIFINCMAYLANNSIFLQNIAATATSKLFIDQSHLPPTNLSHTKNLLASVRDSVTTPVGAAILVILVLTVTLMPIWRERTRH
ncbi:DUF4350 domain-containing protein [Chloroflexota bacterium]